MSHSPTKDFRWPDERPSMEDIEADASWAMQEIGKLRRDRAELLATVKTLLDQAHADCLREGEEAAVDAAAALIARIGGNST